MFNNSLVLFLWEASTCCSQTAVDDKRPAMGVQGPTQLAFNVTPEIDVAIEQAAVAIDK